jgi:hypothetical protein
LQRPFHFPPLPCRLRPRPILPRVHRLSLPRHQQPVPLFTASRQIPSPPRSRLSTVHVLLFPLTFRRSTLQALAQAPVDCRALRSRFLQQQRREAGQESLNLTTLMRMINLFSLSRPTNTSFPDRNTCQARAAPACCFCPWLTSGLLD